MQNGRYNWKHDQTLKAAVANGILPFIKLKGKLKLYIPPEDISYDCYQIRHCRWCNLMESSSASPKKRSKKPPAEGQWLGILMDEEPKQVVFPPIITETANRDCKTSWNHHLFWKNQHSYHHWAYSPNGGKPVKCQRKKEMQMPRYCSWMRK